MVDTGFSQNKNTDIMKDEQKKWLAKVWGSPMRKLAARTEEKRGEEG